MELVRVEKLPVRSDDKSGNPDGLQDKLGVHWLWEGGGKHPP